MTPSKQTVKASAKAALALVAALEVAGCSSTMQQAPMYSAPARTTSYENDPGYNQQVVQPGYQPQYSAPAIGFRRMNERPAGPRLTQWGFNTYANGAFEGCWIYQNTAYINSQTGQVESYFKVVGQRINTTKELCSITQGVMNPLLEQIQTNPYRPRPRYGY